MTPVLVEIFSPVTRPCLKTTGNVHTHLWRNNIWWKISSGVLRNINWTDSSCGQWLTGHKHTRCHPWVLLFLVHSDHESAPVRSWCHRSPNSPFGKSAPLKVFSKKCLHFNDFWRAKILEENMCFHNWAVNADENFFWVQVREMLLIGLIITKISLSKEITITEKHISLKSVYNLYTMNLLAQISPW